MNAAEVEALLNKAPDNSETIVTGLPPTMITALRERDVYFVQMTNGTSYRFVGASVLDPEFVTIHRESAPDIDIKIAHISACGVE